MRYVVLLLVCFSSLGAFGQATPAAGSTSAYPVIVYTPNNKTDVPIDRRFYVKVPGLVLDRAAKISVYRLEAKDGIYTIGDKKGDDVLSSFKFAASDITYAKDNTTLFFPAIRPEKTFDILVLKKMSKENLSRALAINYLISQKYARTWPVVDTAKLNHDNSLNALYKTLKDSLNRSEKYEYKPKVISGFLSTYKEDYFDPAISHYQKLFPEDYGKPATLKSLPFLEQWEIQAIREYIAHDGLLYSQIYLLQRIHDDHSFRDILSGMLPMRYAYPLKPAESHNIEERNKNLGATSLFLDSLERLTADLKALHPRLFDRIDDHVYSMMKAAIANRDSLKKETDAVSAVLLAKNTEANWLSGYTNSSPDLLTVSKRHITVDAGFMNIWAYNRQNHYTRIPKLFFGINYFFRANDKNVTSDDIHKVDKKDGYSHSLETQSLFWQRFSITAGVTLGEMNTPDFANVTGTFSFTGGVSYRIIPGIRLGAGAAVVKRLNNNPLESGKSTVIGNYVSISADYDLLSAAKSVVDLIFK